MDDADTMMISGAVGAAQTLYSANLMPSGNITIPNGGGGGSGQYIISQPNIGLGQASSWSTSTTMLSIMAENGGDAVIKTHKHKINLDEMAEITATLKERLLILVPNFEKHEKYPALKEAYEHYKLIEALCKDEDK